jgi:hypothetical protein
MSQDAGWSAASQLRIGDAEREAAVAALGEHYAAGRLTKVEYDERAERAWSARTSAQLWPLFTDLPRPEAPGTGGDAGWRQDRPGAGGWGPGRRTGCGRGRGTGLLFPLLVVLAVVTVLTHLPLILLGLVVWLVWVNLGRGRRASRAAREWRAWHGSTHGPGRYRGW